MLRRLKVFASQIGQNVHSIRFRMAAWMLTTLAVVLFSYSSIIFYLQYQELKSGAKDTLDRYSYSFVMSYQGYLREIGEHGGANPQMIATLNSLVNNLQVLGDSLAVVGPDGNIVQSVGSPNQSQVSEIAQNYQAIDQGQGPIRGALYVQVRESALDLAHPGSMYAVREIRSPFSPDRYLVMISSHIDPTGRLPQLFTDLTLGSFGLLLLAMLGSYWLTGRLIAPVSKITRTAQEINGSDLTRRIHLNTRDELGELARTFDRMLDRLQGAFDRQRQFTADASHELRTPLTIVDLEATRALEHRRTPEDYERALRVIQSENEFMASLVNNLLTLARMDAGRAMLKPDLIDLGDLALEVVERLETLARERGVELDTGELPEVAIHGDRQYLIQMLSNLVENAIKYSREEGARVCVDAGTRSNGAKTVGWIRVEDNGPGIPAEAIPHLFDRFYRVDTARSHNPEGSPEKSEIGGSGLGLAIVEWIVNAHGGTIQITSQVGQGSTFEVELPLAST